ncbi:MAG: diguanylate cyclase [Desulfobacterales bacterium]|nr:diguanylate cyclase [Desulfobacterales bacterium]
MIPGYRIDETIYTSENSLIYRGVRTRDQVPVILKVLNSQYPEPESLTRFRQEYAITDSLKIKGVVTALGFEQTGNRVMIILKDIRGDSLANHLSRSDSPMPLNDFLSLAIRLTGILEQIHENEIIHKDINPTNIIWNQSEDILEFIDFGISTELPREAQAVSSPEMLEGTLAYMSPEQTGRMNRAVDFRSDLYSLGVTFYRMLAGKTPFDTDDAMEMVHSHIARPPSPLSREIRGVPSPVSDIVMKLMSKMAEDRYHSVGGLRADLERCHKTLAKNQTIAPFDLGQQDRPSRFQIPQILYGRNRETRVLMEAFSRVGSGSLEMLLVSGYSGVGKSSLIREIYKPVVTRNGLFISGKFDQFQNDIPYHPIIQALKTLVNYLLSEPAARLGTWKARIETALGPEARVITQVIPQLELIIGKQKPVLELSGIEARKRFNTVFKRFIQALATRNHPLVLFLDDLQWADPASLKLIHTLMSGTTGSHLLILGAFRDNEVSPAHPLMLKLDDIRNDKLSEAKVSTLHLAPLMPDDTTRMIAGTLSTTTDAVRPLAGLIQEKTGGNPFFMIQVLTSLYLKKHLSFSRKTNAWTWDMDHIRGLGISENVADLLVEKINRLPVETKRLLLLSSCLGNQFDLGTLSIISRSRFSRVSMGLWKAVQEELIIPQSKKCRSFRWADETGAAVDPARVSYRFFHDRIQEAAYSRLSPSERSGIHLAAGRLLLENTSEENLRNHIFDIVNHLNFSGPLITDRKEKDRLAHLNLMAGRQAKKATAYNAALDYISAGMDLLSGSGWKRQYNTMIRLTLERIECEFLCGNQEAAHEIFTSAIDHARGRQEKGKLYELMIRICHINYDYDRGIELGKKGLSLFNIKIPDITADYDSETAALLEFITTHAGSQEDIRRLKDGPAMTDPDAITCCGLLHELWVCLFMSANDRVLLPALIMIKLSIEHGQSAVTSVGIIFYGLILSMQQEYDRAYAFGQLAMALKDKYFTPLLAPKVHNTFCNFINHYKQHIKTNIPIYEDSLKYCIQSGEIWWGAWAASFLRTAALVKGDPLDRVRHIGEKYADYIREAEFAPLIQIRDAQMAKLTNLMDETGTRDSLDNEHFDESAAIAAMESMPFGLGLFWHFVYKAFVLLLYGEHGKALDASLKAEENKSHIPGLMMYPDHFFFNTLILTANWKNAGESQRQAYDRQIRENLDQMKQWETHCPENFSHRYHLMTAELERIREDELAALESYGQAISLARANEYLHHEALANELAGRFHLEKGRDIAARGHLMEARFLYLRWGAKRKVRILDDEFPNLALVSDKAHTRHTILTTSRSQALDFDSVIKASQAISGEIVLEKLLKKLMGILMENAGARKGALVIENAGRLVISARGDMDSGIEVNLDPVPVDALEPDQILSSAILHYAARRRKNVVLTDAATQGQFIADPYVTANRPKSILCIPLIYKTRLDGLLYLENNLAAGAFTPDRLETLTLLSTHAAIAIENAELYTTLEAKVADRTIELSEANAALEAEIAERKRAEKALKAANRELHHLASLDGLTGIANRRYFDAYLGNEWKRMRREKAPISLILCDIDYFKNYNDTYGHQEGDDCLKLVARTMADAVKRPADLVARYGGEEFVLVLPRSDRDGAMHIAGIIRDSIRALAIAHIGSRAGKVVTLSMGVSTVIPDRHTEMAALIYEADQALYDAKNSGRNRIRFAKEIKP